MFPWGRFGYVRSSINTGSRVVVRVADRSDHQPGCVGDRVRAAAPALARAELRAGDYRRAIQDARRGDFVYIDPPYDGTFRGYTAEPFDAAAQAELAFEVRRLALRGVRVMWSTYRYTWHSRSGQQVSCLVALFLKIFGDRLSSFSLITCSCSCSHLVTNCVQLVAQSATRSAACSLADSLSARIAAAPARSSPRVEVVAAATAASSARSELLGPAT